MRTAGAILAMRLLLATAAEVPDKESCAAPTPEPGSQLLQKASKVQKVRTAGLVEEGRAVRQEAGAELRTNYSTSTQYCTQSMDDCWNNKPPSSTAACTVNSGRTTCRCADVDCDIKKLDWATPTTGRCAKKIVYVAGGSAHTNADSHALDVTGSGEEAFCMDMVKNDRWKAKHLVKLSSDPPASNGKSYWRCWRPNRWWDNKCQRTTRYLGESCWTSHLGSGRCAGDDKSYDEYSTSCYNDKCVPYSHVRERKPCSCAWVGWNFLVACTAADGACGGHACVLTTGGGGGFYCDYATSANW